MFNCCCNESTFSCKSTHGELIMFMCRRTRRCAYVCQKSEKKSVCAKQTQKYRYKVSKQECIQTLVSLGAISRHFSVGYRLVRKRLQSIQNLFMFWVLFIFRLFLSILKSICASFAICQILYYLQFGTAAHCACDSSIFPRILIEYKKSSLFPMILNIGTNTRKKRCILHQRKRFIHNLCTCDMGAEQLAKIVNDSTLERSTNQFNCIWAHFNQD